MPVRPEFRKYYGYQWRAKIRPAILKRDGYCCRRCGRPWNLEIAHLDGDPSNLDDDNLATLCRACHRRHDYPLWAARSRETRIVHKDAKRAWWPGSIAF